MRAKTVLFLVSGLALIHDVFCSSSSPSKAKHQVRNSSISVLNADVANGKLWWGKECTTREHTVSLTNECAFPFVCDGNSCDYKLCSDNSYCNAYLNTECDSFGTCIAKKCSSEPCPSGYECKEWGNLEKGSFPIPKPPGKVPIPLIVGVIAGVLLLIIIAVVVFIVKKKSSKNVQVEPKKETGPELIPMPEATI